MDTIENIKATVGQYATSDNIMKIGVITLVIGIIYSLYKHIKTTLTNRPYLSKDMHDGSTEKKVSGDKIRRSEYGHEFSYSFWLYVNDWGHNFNNPKHIFHVGDPEGKNVCPGIWLYPKTNNLMVRVDTYSNPVSHMNPSINKKVLRKENPCDLVNIPVQRWVHVVVTMINKTVDIYLNGKLTRSCTMEHVPRINDGDVHMCKDGGFAGKISNLIYYNQAYSPAQVYRIYLRGPSAFDPMKYMDKLIKAVPKPKMNLKLNVSVSADVNGNKVGGSSSLGK